MLLDSYATKVVVLERADATGRQLLPPASGLVYGPIKVVADWCAALVLLVLTAPLILLAYLGMRLTSAGPGFYSQIRLGKDGRPYRIYKLRTMYHNCEKQSGACWSTAGDPRITALGRFLRATHLDELPQLWNVLRGQMSLVGPRPERPEFVPELEKAVPRYRERLRVRPGLTGLAQVQLPADTDLAGVRRKTSHDLYYVDNRTFFLDVRILLSTALKVLGFPFGLGKFLLALPGGAAVEEAYEKKIREDQISEEAAALAPRLAPSEPSRELQPQAT